jgi:hypothetical protein
VLQLPLRELLGELHKKRQRMRDAAAALKGFFSVLGEPIAKDLRDPRYDVSREVQ